MPFRIIRNDITKVAADAVVNTANPAPRIGAGTDYAIHTAAGPELLEARKKIGFLDFGECAATPAFNLPAKYVLHTVSPVWDGGQHGEEALLRRAYDSALHLAASLGCKSVAFPLLSAGTYAFPHDVALSTAIRAFTDFLLEHDMLIVLVLFDERAFGLASSIFDGLKSYIDDRYAEERHSEEYLADKIRFGRKSGSLNLRRSAAPADSAAGIGDMERSAERTPAAKLPDTAVFPSSLQDVLRQSERTFSEYLLDLLREREGKDSEVYKRAEVSKQLFSKILSNPAYRPTKNTVLQLAIGLQLNLPETQALLARAGFTLTRSSKTDLVVQYYIERKIYSVSFINEALYDCGLPLLGSGARA